MAKWMMTTIDEEIDAALERAKREPEQAADFKISLHGTSIWWTQMDEGHELENMLQGRTGNEKWMARLQRVEVAA